MSVVGHNSPYSLYFWLEEFQEEDDWAAVMRTARELLHLVPDNPEGLKFLAEAYFRLGKSVEAYEVALRLIQVNPVSIDGYWILSDLAAQADDLERSAYYIECAARLIPNSDAIWVEVARAHFNLTQLARCLIACDHGLKINPQNIRLLIYKVFCLAGLRSVKGAKIAASRLVSLGVDAEVLRDTAKELGISGASLARITSLANGQSATLPAGSTVSRRRTETAIHGGLNLLSEVTAKAAPLTPRQFAIQLAIAQNQVTDGMEEDLAPSQFEATDPEMEVETAEMVYYVYDRFRTHGPYVLLNLKELFLDNTFSLRDAYIRRETDHEWLQARDIAELAQADSAIN